MTDKVYEYTRKRSPNFTRKENRVLAELLQVYEAQIEIKRTDQASNMRKNRAWQELAKDFNARLGGDPYRSATVLKHKYDNIKKEARRNMRNKAKMTYIKKSVTTIPSDTSNIEIETVEEGNEGEMSMDVKDYIRDTLMDEQNGDDEVSDAEENPPVQPKIEIEQTDTYEFDNQTHNKSEVEFQVYHSLDELQRKCFLEEHKLKLQHMQEKHSLELEFIRQKHKEMIRMMRQEHDSKMEYLEMEKTVGIINKL